MRDLFVTCYCIFVHYMCNNYQGNFSMQFDTWFVSRAIPGVKFITTIFPKKIRFSIDTRTLVPGDIFVAIKGTRFDGHEFIVSALEKGAAGILCQESGLGYIQKFTDQDALKKTCIMIVPDTTKALCMLAHAWRKQFSYPVVAITGSVGKTSTKEYLAYIMKANKKNYIVSQGNQNTFIGIALTMLSMRDDHDGAIFEIGIDKAGQMKEKAALVDPTIAIITSVGHSHMEGIGSLGNIASEKRDIFSSFKESNIGIINGDQAVLSSMGYPHPIVKFGFKLSNQVQARKVVIDSNGSSFILKLYDQKVSLTLPVIHKGALMNQLAAVSGAHFLGVSFPIILDSLKNLPLVNQRFVLHTLAQHSLIDDCYNASPESMKSALLAFELISTNQKKIAILGDMYELGSDSAFWHRQIGRFLRKITSLDILVLVGSEVKQMIRFIPDRVLVISVATWHEAIIEIDRLLAESPSLLLVKASRGMALNNIVDHVLKKYDNRNLINIIPAQGIESNQL